MKRLILSLAIAISALSLITLVGCAKDSDIKKECIDAAKKDSALIAEVGIAKIDSLADLLEKFDFSAVNKIISRECAIPESLLTKHPYKIKFMSAGTDKWANDLAGFVKRYTDTIFLSADYPSLYFDGVLLHEYIHSLTSIDSTNRAYRNFKWADTLTREEWVKKGWSYSLPGIPHLLNEGITQWVTERVYSKSYHQNFDLPFLAYEKPVATVQIIADVVGPEVLMYAFLNGDVDSLQTAFNTELGNNAWQEYLKRLSVCGERRTKKDAEKILSITESFINSSEFSSPKPSPSKLPIRPAFLK
ncbi:MAG: hypothetical protein AAB465_03255 [Patescibacteria group bacterium]